MGRLCTTYAQFTKEFEQFCYFDDAVHLSPHCDIKVTSNQGHLQEDFHREVRAALSQPLWFAVSIFQYI